MTRGAPITPDSPGPHTYTVRPVTGGAWFDLGYRFEVVDVQSRSGGGHYRTEEEARHRAEQLNQAKDN